MYPCKYFECSFDDRFIIEEHHSGKQIAALSYHADKTPYVTKEEQKKNAQMMSASYEMYQALAMVLPLLGDDVRDMLDEDDNPDLVEAYNAVNDALKLARPELYA